MNVQQALHAHATRQQRKLNCVETDDLQHWNSRLTEQDRADGPAAQVVDGLSESQTNCSLNRAALGEGSCNSRGSSRHLDGAGCDD